MGTMFGSVEDYGEMFQDSIAQTKDVSLSSTEQIGNPAVYRLVRVARDGTLVPATDEEMVEVKDLLGDSEKDMPIVPDPGQTEEYIPDEGSPSQFLQLDSFEGLFQPETAEAYIENLNFRLESKEELVYGSQMLYTLPDINDQSSIELPGNEEFIQTEFLLQEPILFLSNGCSMDQSMDVSPYSIATGGSPNAPALSTTTTDKICLGNHSIKALQETYRATFGRETTCKDKHWLKRKIKMGLISPYVMPTTSMTVNDDKLIRGGQDNCNDTGVAFSKDTAAEGRANNCKDTPSSPDFIKGHPNDFGDDPVDAFVERYSGSEDFEGEYRSAKRVRKPTRRYIEEISKVDEKQQSSESVIPSKDERVASGRRVVVTRMITFAGSRIQVPYVSHVRRSRPRENIMALGEFHTGLWEVKATPQVSNLNLSQAQLNNGVNRVLGGKSVSGPIQKKLTTNHQSYKDHSKPKLREVDEDIMEPEPEYMDSSGDSSDDSAYDRVDRPMMQSAIRRKHHRAWSLSEVKKLVEGVSKYGVGKWSVIKKLSFSSYSYRTPVDLKDKWRNLLKASFAPAPLNKMGSLRKHGSMAIPSQVLSEVRELAQKKSHVTPARKARMMKASRHGFL